MLALLFGILALLFAPGARDASFIDAGLTRSQPVVIEGFIGLQWSCSPTDDEMCYAGFGQTGADDNGVPEWSLTTGP